MKKRTFNTKTVVFGAFLVIVGTGIFNVGAEMSMTPMGEYVGSQMYDPVCNRGNVSPVHCSVTGLPMGHNSNAGMRHPGGALLGDRSMEFAGISSSLHTTAA